MLSNTAHKSEPQRADPALRESAWTCIVLAVLTIAVTIYWSLGPFRRLIAEITRRGMEQFPDNSVTVFAIVSLVDELVIVGLGVYASIQVFRRRRTARTLMIFYFNFLLLASIIEFYGVLRTPAPWEADIDVMGSAMKIASSSIAACVWGWYFSSSKGIAALLVR